MRPAHQRLYILVKCQDVSSSMVGGMPFAHYKCNKGGMQ
jgi:hypothetical protein